MGLDLVDSDRSTPWDSLLLCFQGTVDNGAYVLFVYHPFLMSNQMIWPVDGLLIICYGPKYFVRFVPRTAYSPILGLLIFYLYIAGSLNTRNSYPQARKQKWEACFTFSHTNQTCWQAACHIATPCQCLGTRDVVWIRQLNFYFIYTWYSLYQRLV